MQQTLLTFCVCLILMPWRGSAAPTDPPVSAHSVTLAADGTPTATLSGDGTVCPGQPTPIGVALTGTAPWTLTWSDGVQQTSAEANATRIVSPTNNVTYFLTGLSDASGAANFEDLGESVLIRVEPKLTATLSNITTNVCSGEPQQLRVAFTGRGPWVVTWSDGSTSTATTSPALLEVTAFNTNASRTITTNFTIRSLSNASCTAAAADLKGNAILNVAPRPTAVVSGDITLCEGSTASIQAVLTGVGPWVVVWSDGVIENATASPARRTVRPAGTTEYRVKALSDRNCSARAEDLTGLVTVDVLPRPRGTVSGVATICNRGSTEIQADLTGLGPWTVTWSDGLVQSNVLQSPVVRTVSGTNETPASVVTNRYSLRAIATLECRSQASDLQGEAIVRVQNGPTSTVTGTNTVCSGQPALIQLTLTGTGPWEISWSDGFVQSVAHAITNRLVSPQNPSATETTALSYTITNLVDAICTASVSQLKGRGLVNVYPRTGATLTGGGTVCTEGAAVLSVELTGTAPWTLVWSDGFQQTTNGPIALRVVNPTTTTNLFLTSVTDGRCQADPSELRGNATISLSAPPSAVVSGDAMLCLGQTVPIQATLTGTGPWTLIWSDGFVQSNILQSPVTRLISLTNNASGNAVTNRFFLTALTAGDCQARPADLTGEAVLVTPERPTVAVSGPSGSICAGDTALLQVTLTGQGPWTVTWSDGEVATYFESPTNRIVQPTRLSTYSVRALQDANCAALPEDIAGNNVLVRVNPAPAVPISLGDVTNTLEGTLSQPLAVQAPTGNVVVDWFSSATGGVVLATGTNSFQPTNLVAGAYLYYAEARNAQSGCLSTNRTPVSLTIVPRLVLQLQPIEGSAQLLSWFGAYGLQTTTNLFGPAEAPNWVNIVTGQVSTLNFHTNTSSERERYFRLFQP